MSAPNDSVPRSHPKFDDPSCDVVFESSPDILEDGSLGKTTVFRLSSASLRKASSVFDDMLQVGKGSGAEGKPIRLSESTEILEMLLAFTLDDIDRFPELDSVSLEDLCNLLNACAKYGLLMPQVYAEKQIKYVITLFLRFDADMPILERQLLNPAFQAQQDTCDILEVLCTAQIHNRSALAKAAIVAMGMRKMRLANVPGHHSPHFGAAHGADCMRSFCVCFAYSADTCRLSLVRTISPHSSGPSAAPVTKSESAVGIRTGPRH